MTTSANKINWYFTVVGLFLLAGYFYPKKTTVSDIDLNSKTITLSHNIEFLKGGSRQSSFHRLWTNQTKAAFIIDVPGAIAAKRSALDSLQQSDTLTIKYFSERETDLKNGAKEIPIYFLQKADKLYFDTTAYNHAATAYNKRLNWIILIIGVLLTLNGLTIINMRTAFILAGISVAIIVVLRLLNKF
jgi:hypothetical protein